VVALLDVNVVVALAWPNHVHHVAAHTWLSSWTDRWATTAVTEAGFVRVSSSGIASAAAVRPVDAISLFGRIRGHPDHDFWPDTIEGVVGNAVAPERVLGHRQATDAHLLALAIAQGGTVATFDAGMRSLVVGRRHARHVTVLSAT